MAKTIEEMMNDPELLAQLGKQVAGQMQGQDSEEQQMILSQMAAQAEPMPESQPLPPPPTPSPLSSNPVPRQAMGDAGYGDILKKLKGYSTARESEMEKIKQYMGDYAKAPRGTDFRPMAAFFSKLTNNPELMRTAEGLAPESQTDKTKNMIGFQQKLAQLAGDQKQADSAQRHASEQNRLQFMRDKMERGERSLALREAQTLENNVQKFEKSRQGKAALDASINTLEGKLGFKLDDYDMETNMANGSSIDLPGVNVPGLGRVGVYDKEARQIDTAMARVFNVELHDRSGAAVTTPEMKRLELEFSAGAFQTEPEKIQAVKDYTRLLKEELKRRDAAFSPEVRDLYQDRLTGMQGPAPSGGGAFGADKMKRMEELRKKAGR